MASDQTSAADRLRKALETPASLMGGESFILDIADVKEVIVEIETLRTKVLRLEGHNESLRDTIRAARKALGCDHE